MFALLNYDTAREKRSYERISLTFCIIVQCTVKPPHNGIWQVASKSPLTPPFPWRLELYFNIPGIFDSWPVIKSASVHFPHIFQRLSFVPDPALLP